jgi:hypothetical protein
MKRALLGVLLTLTICGLVPASSRHRIVYFTLVRAGRTDVRSMWQEEDHAAGFSGASFAYSLTPHVIDPETIRMDVGVLPSKGDNSESSAIESFTVHAGESFQTTKTDPIVIVGFVKLCKAHKRCR